MESTRLFTQPLPGGELDKPQTSGAGELSLPRVETREVSHFAGHGHRDMQQIERAADLFWRMAAGNVFGLCKYCRPGEWFAFEFFRDAIVVKEPQAAGEVGLGDLFSENLLSEAIPELQLLKFVDENGLVLSANKCANPGTERLGAVEGDETTWVVIDSHRLPSMMIWLPGFPGAGLPPKISSTFAQVPAQSTLRRFFGIGTILATAFLRLVTSTSSPALTRRKRAEKLFSASSTVTDFMVVKIDTIAKRGQ